MTASDEGDVRVIAQDSNGSTRVKLAEWATEFLDANTTLRDMLIVPYMFKNKMNEDDQLVVEVKVGTASSADYGLSSVRIPITKLNKATGQLTPTYLRDSDLRSADVTLTANTWVTLGTYTVSAQETIVLGHAIPDNSRVYITFIENA